MSVWGIDEEAAIAAAPAYIPPPKPKTSAWADVGSVLSAVPRGIGEAAAQVMGTAADAAGAYRAIRDATPAQRKAIDRGGVPVESFSSGFGDALRDRGREFRPDPQTAGTAEQILYGFSRGASKIIAGAAAGGIPGVIAAGLEEAVSTADDLRREGVDIDTRAKAGLVQGAGLALAALPAAGQTVAGTLGLYAAGGPGGFIAQQALTREILRGAGYEQLGMGYDPLDPVGLAVSSLIPAGFAAWGFRQAKIAQAVKSLPDLPRAGDAPPVEAAHAAVGAAPPSELSPVARAAMRYPQEVEDAARVLHQTEVRDAANPGAGLRAADQHAEALARAEDQIARGEPVRVADVAPVPRVPAIETPEFKAWFGDSKVVDADGKPLVLYHGTASDFDTFDPAGAGRQMDAGKLGEGIYLSQSPKWASNYAGAAVGRSPDGAPNVVPAYVTIRNPLVLDGPGTVWQKLQSISDEWGLGLKVAVAEDGNKPNATWSKSFAAEAQKRGYDGVELPSVPGQTEFVAFRPEQIKSAIGNSGKFDPNSASLTDSPYATWEAQVRAAIQDMRGAEDATRDAPNLRPSEATIELRKRASIIESLLECLS